MERLEGGYLGARPTWSNAASPGVWTLEQALARRAAGTWPATTPLFDPYFESVSLLLHMNGSNASTTFVDSSLGNLAVTANGNAQISTAQSKFGGSSGAFDGTGDYLTLPSNTAFDLIGDYTIEFWVYPASTPNYNFGLVHRGFYSTVTANWTGLAFSIRCLGSGGSGNLRFYFYATTGASEQVINTTGSLVANTWTHIAMSRSGTTGYAFINGVLAGTITSLNTPAASSETLRIGRWDYSAGNEDFNGYIDELRITRGVARYTANFAVPGVGSDEGAALYDPYFDYVSLLLRCNGDNNSTTFTDSSNNALAITRNGDAKITTTQARFGGASAYFDGTGDGLSLASNAAFGFGTGDFTIEMWLYQSVSPTSGSANLIDNRTALDASPFTFYLKYSASGTALGVYTSIGAAGCEWDSASQRLAVNTWNHIALVRRSGSFSAFINGTKCTTVSFGNETAISGDFGASKPLRVGIAVDGSSAPLNGYIDDLRITKGVARYTTNFRPVGPYATSGKLVDPYLTNTSLLLPMTGNNNNTSFFDRSNNFLRATENGNARVSTTQSKFGGTSAYFDGTGDYLALSNPSLYSFGTGDFTVEAWIYRVTPVVYSALLEVGNHSNTDSALFLIGTGGIQLYSAAFYGSGTLSTGVWQHVAWSRSSGTLRTFVDGQLTSTTAFSNNLTSSTQASVGYAAGYNGGANYYHNGYIDDLRITKGTARYTTAFTPPERAFNDEAFNDPDYNNVSLLLHMDGANNSTTFTDSSVNGLTVTANGDAKISTAQSRFGGASAVFDGTGDYLAIPGSSMPLGSNDWTVEGWFYRNSTGRIDTLLRGDNGTISGFGLDINFNLSNALVFGLDGTNTVVVSVPSGTHNIVSTTWYHIAFTRSGSTWRVFVNGVLVGTGTNASSITTPTTYRLGGNSFDGIYNWSGYIDEFRVTRGVARYTSNFTPPTLPFYNTTISTVDPSFSSVSLLLHMNGSNGSTTFTDSSSNALAVSRVGDTQISTAQGRFGGASAYFDGTGDYLTLPASNLFAFGTGDFTVELWIYPLGGMSRVLTNRAPATALTGTWSFQINSSTNSTSLTFTEVIGGEPGPSAALAYGILNQWSHVAACRSSGVTRIFLNGFLVASASQATNFYEVRTLYIGTSPTENVSYGYMDDIRVTKGVARYTSNFYIPRAAFPDA